MEIFLNVLKQSDYMKLLQGSYVQCCAKTLIMQPAAELQICSSETILQNQFSTNKNPSLLLLNIQWHRQSTCIFAYLNRIKSFNTYLTFDILIFPPALSGKANLIFVFLEGTIKCRQKAGAGAFCWASYVLPSPHLPPGTYRWVSTNLILAGVVPQSGPSRLVSFHPSTDLQESCPVYTCKPTVNTSYHPYFTWISSNLAVCLPVQG